MEGSESELQTKFLVDLMDIDLCNANGAREEKLEGSN